jgi:hypothetical protein
MTGRYTAPGLRFRYPEEWQLAEDRAADELTVTVRPDADATGFWSITLLFNRPSPDEALRTIEQAFADEYDELDVYPVDAKVARRKALGRDIDFVCFELTNSGCVRVFQTPRFTAVVLYQATDLEMKSLRDEFAQITASIECDADDLPLS